MTADEPRVPVETRREWRDWLAAHHADSRGAWVVTWRRDTGRPAPGYEDLVEEALCFGWVDSTARRLDDERTMLRFSPRRPGGGWARTNKERVERLIASGAMTPAGQRVIDEAKADGSWTLLDDVENLVAAAETEQDPGATSRDDSPRVRPADRTPGRRAGRVSRHRRSATLLSRPVM